MVVIAEVEKMRERILGIIPEYSRCHNDYDNHDHEHHKAITITTSCNAWQGRSTGPLHLRVIMRELSLYETFAGHAMDLAEAAQITYHVGLT